MSRSDTRVRRGRRRCPAPGRPSRPGRAVALRAARSRRAGGGSSRGCRGGRPRPPRPVVCQAVVQLMRQAFHHAPRVHEDERRLVVLDLFGNPVDQDLAHPVPFVEATASEFTSRTAPSRDPAPCDVPRRRSCSAACLWRRSDRAPLRPAAWPRARSDAGSRTARSARASRRRAPPGARELSARCDPRLSRAIA